MWDLMLKWHFDKKERVALYCHYLPYEKGSGFASAARYYFGKSANTLNTDELATIVAIGRSPGYNSPSRHPDHLDAAKKSLLSAYEGAR
jgi:membrane carboxypeptidase/penicillin-binding protein PbpC